MFPEESCRFCNQGNRPDRLDAGLTEKDLNYIDDANWSGFSDRDLAAPLR